ncbi:dihydrofolate reductase family protein [Exiguobacterium oxidotolerans]|uniref:Bacterial bifunctional deaminase-reductase C-terminal domain-containing protein n=1 Tax=Exiguobacterium oxidotolerans TaxID=223958 RepID=A0A653IEI5_9BACL|nr:dihydrofolate reductase family protein [Exiguobacterium oxidotolerans]VWX37657.1 conserved hypothetical protein [Exiguobacterium oxidotolerans]
MSKTVLYIAMSLDGKIARIDDSLDWLYAVTGEGDNGYETFLAGVGTVIMGRKTYDEVLKLSDSYPYSGIPSYVLTRKDRRNTNDVTFTNQSITELIEHARTTHSGNIWIVGGGELIKSALDAQVVERLELAVAPIVLGSGIPLFPEGTRETAFILRTHRQSGQFMMLTYDVSV